MQIPYRLKLIESVLDMEFQGPIISRSHDLSQYPL